MVELVLQEDIQRCTAQATAQCTRNVISQVARIIPPWQGDDFHVISFSAQVFYQNAVINISAGDVLEVTVNNQTDAHGRSCR